MKKTKFQILSDLHLEVNNQYNSFEIPPCAPYLILAGDIGHLIDRDRYHDFLAKQCAQFQKVFLVLGNHEFYGVTREEGLTIAEDLASKLDGLVLLQQRSLELNDGLMILGCILGSWIPEDAASTVALMVNDFRHIKDWTVAKHNEVHQQDLAWLKNELAATRTSSRVLVVTHYAPQISGTSAPNHAASPIMSNFATDLLDNDSHQELARVNTWVFGHTHHTNDLRSAGGTRVVSNQRGYVFSGQEKQKTAPTTISMQVRGLFGSSDSKVYDVRRTIEI